MDGLAARFPGWQEDEMKKLDREFKRMPTLVWQSVY